MDCPLAQQPDGTWRCPVCGDRRRKFYRVNCRGVDAADQFPTAVHQAWDLAASLAAFVADGCRLVDADEYAARLEVCEACDRRRGRHCLECGCRIDLKARGRAFRCPLGLWPISGPRPA